MNRRGFLGSILAACAAPAIVRADSLMRIVPVDTGILLAGDKAITACSGLVEYGDFIRYAGYSRFAMAEEWLNYPSLPAQAKRDIDQRIDVIAAQTGSPIVDREYIWFPAGHQDKSDPLGQHAVVGCKGKAIR